jgi:chemotaxis protein MotB
VAGSKLREWLALQTMLRSLRPGDYKDTKRIIKKKSHETGEDARSSIWKIAYADFMTAMMTFFLVMWLVNATSKDRVVQLASYFNPAKFSDPAPFVRGVRDAQRNHGRNERASPAELQVIEYKNAAKRAAASREEEEEVLFSNPLPGLAQLAVQAETPIPVQASKDPNPLTGDGTSRDPFLTDYIVRPLVKWISAILQHETDGATVPQAPPAPDRKTGAEAAEDGKSRDAAASPSREVEAYAAQERKPAGTKTEPAFAGAQKKLEIQARAEQLERDISQLLAALPKTPGPEITVKAVAEGVLISMTDGTGFSMFKISSAVPSPPLVLFLERLGGIIAKYPGGIVVKGHTDSRPYARDSHGNWRLSVNRATMTYYMLLRGKVGDERFLALKGHAERDLKNKADPHAAENRRIEILIRLPEETGS